MFFYEKREEKEREQRKMDKELLFKQFNKKGNEVPTSVLSD